MRRTIIAVIAILAAGHFAALEAHAQVLRPAPAPGEDWGTVKLDLGMLAPLSTFTDDQFGESSFNSAGAFGASALFWPWQGRLGVGAKLIRSHTEGHNAEHEFAPIAVNDPVQWLFTGEVAVRHLMERAGMDLFPYVAVGLGLKQYNWKRSVHDEDRFFLWSVGGGVELRPAALGPFGVTLDLRSYHSEFIGFGIDDGTWEPGTEARPGIGFYGGVVGGQSNHDLLFTAGLSVPF